MQKGASLTLMCDSFARHCCGVSARVLGSRLFLFPSHGGVSDAIHSAHWRELRRDAAGAEATGPPPAAGASDVLRGGDEAAESAVVGTVSRTGAIAMKRAPKAQKLSDGIRPARFSWSSQVFCASRGNRPSEIANQPLSDS